MESGDNVVGFSTPQSDGTYLEKEENILTNIL
jgi:hypothetical protein